MNEEEELEVIKVMTSLHSGSITGHLLTAAAFFYKQCQGRFFLTVLKLYSVLKYTSRPFGIYTSSLISWALPFVIRLRDFLAVLRLSNLKSSVFNEIVKRLSVHETNQFYNIMLFALCNHKL